MGGRAKLYGRKAFENGKHISHNPFRGGKTPEDVVNEMDWEKGWIAARDEEEEKARPLGKAG